MRSNIRLIKVPKKEIREKRRGENFQRINAVTSALLEDIWFQSDRGPESPVQ